VRESTVAGDEVAVQTDIAAEKSTAVANKVPAESHTAKENFTITGNLIAVETTTAAKAHIPVQGEADVRANTVPRLMKIREILMLLRETFMML